MELSENVKLRLDTPTAESQQDRLSRVSNQNTSADAGSNDEAESQMRRALGLLGEPPRHRPEADRLEQPVRAGGGYGGGLHRRRFVQDGDIPVTVLRREPGHDAPPHRVIAPANVPTSSRLQRAESALATETAAREKAERSLNEAFAVVKDLQTKIGHAELARNEAIEELRRERETAAQMRTEVQGWEARLQEAYQQVQAAEGAAQAYQDQLAEERQARKVAEKALAAAEAARDAAQELVRTLSDETSKRSPAPPSRSTRRSAGQQRTEIVSDEPKRAESARRSPRTGNAGDSETKVRRGRITETAAPEPEPVKWWLNTKPAAKRR
jgi:hypothetical protein